LPDFPLPFVLEAGAGRLFLQERWEDQERKGREPSHAGSLVGRAPQDGVHLRLDHRGQQLAQEPRFELFELVLRDAAKRHGSQRAELEASFRLEVRLDFYGSIPISHISFHIHHHVAANGQKSKNPRLTGNRGFQKSFSFFLEDRTHVAGPGGGAVHPNGQPLAVNTLTRRDIQQIIHSTRPIKQTFVRLSRARKADL